MDKPFVAENARERKKLTALVKQLTDEELRIPLEDGRTIAAVLAHLAFWNQWSLVRLRRWKQCGVVASSVDLDAVNDTFLSPEMALRLPDCLATRPSSGSTLSGLWIYGRHLEP
jgi:hypothetical protein